MSVSDPSLVLHNFEWIRQTTWYIFDTDPFMSQERLELEEVEEARRRAYEAEMARLEREAEERKKLRQLQEHQEIKRKHVRERLEELRKTPQGSKIFQNIDEEASSWFAFFLIPFGGKLVGEKQWWANAQFAV